MSTKQVNAGTLKIGGGAAVSIQSMLNVPAQDIAGNVCQALELQAEGCELIRVAAPNAKAAKLIEALKNALTVPVCADIHFDYKIALACVEAGADKIRINPGNIGEKEKIRAVAAACRRRKIPIRVGVNSGSLEREILQKYGAPTAEALVESALYHVSLLHSFDFDDMVISMKASDVRRMYDAYVLASKITEYPLHLGVTEAGTEQAGVIKSAAGIGGLLLRGIGDTIRVSLTADPVKEVAAAKRILSAAGVRRFGPNVVSCPTCGRTKVDLISLAQEAERRLASCDRNITVAIMGCAVNGPGEAREADIGIAGGDGCGLIFRRGEVLRKVEEAKLLDELMKEIERVT
ncbi:MAG: flavodoxin-dependent (E)-4-hydroxy-3-methylbut-2-enyl-diphosphate synthase [Oscillospiraceae bacterium]|jgi:(E)-4-hydroxy-3-methylbut-2-enyl-diphosphate synthase|nr:flavodoxin-dependent (E)-4-hydroxy-3-methylbut-2-enyl-diphosphate synthase [Oscillospiraceae bacterium]